jgi:hypothetical protein
VPLGEKWSGKIRDVIIRARVVIADVTALSPEVLFELGFAHGLARATLPVVSGQHWVGRLPRWLTELQIGHFGSPEGWDAIVNSIDQAVNGRVAKKSVVPGICRTLAKPCGSLGRNGSTRGRRSLSM